MSGTWNVLLMTFLFLFFGYLGVPVAFALLAGTLIGAMFTDVSQTAIIQKMFDGMDNEALLAIPFFLLVGELMSSANVVQRVANLSLSLVGHIRGGLSQVVTPSLRRSSPQPQPSRRWCRRASRRWCTAPLAMSRSPGCSWREWCRG